MSNKAIYRGTVMYARHAETRSGKEVTNFTLKANTGPYIKCVAWEEAADELLTDGELVQVEGRLAFMKGYKDRPGEPGINVDSIVRMTEEGGTKDEPDLPTEPAAAKPTENPDDDIPF